MIFCTDGDFVIQNVYNFLLRKVTKRLFYMNNFIFRFNSKSQQIFKDSQNKNDAISLTFIIFQCQLDQNFFISRFRIKYYIFMLDPFQTIKSREDLQALDKALRLRQIDYKSKSASLTVK